MANFNEGKIIHDSRWRRLVNSKNASKFSQNVNFLLSFSHIVFWDVSYCLTYDGNSPFCKANGSDLRDSYQDCLSPILAPVVLFPTV